MGTPARGGGGQVRRLWAQGQWACSGVPGGWCSGGQRGPREGVRVKVGGRRALPGGQEDAGLASEWHLVDTCMLRFTGHSGRCVNRVRTGGSWFRIGGPQAPVWVGGGVRRPQSKPLATGRCGGLVRLSLRNPERPRPLGPRGLCRFLGSPGPQMVLVLHLGDTCLSL